MSGLLILIYVALIMAIGSIVYKIFMRKFSIVVDNSKISIEKTEKYSKDCDNSCIEECGFPSFSYCFPKQETGRVKYDLERRCSVKDAVFAFSKYIHETIGADDTAVIVIDHKKHQCALLKDLEDDIEMVELDYESAFIKSLIDRRARPSDDPKAPDSFSHDNEKNEHGSLDEDELYLSEGALETDDSDDTNELRLLNDLYRLATKRFKKNMNLRRMSENDGLTGLYNHRYFQERLETEIQKAVEKERSLSVLMIDIDHFKYFNDEYGHQMGDRILMELSRLLRKVLREKDVLARYGGEEFAAILIGINKSTAFKVAERMRCEVYDHEFVVDFPVQLRITISIGLSDLSDRSDKRGLIEMADRALFRAKDSGRNMVMG